MTVAVPPRVVLVRPEFAGNIGAVARAMANFGCRDLALVAPRADLSDRQARAMSTKGEFILDAARVFPDLGSAVADCVRVVGTSANLSGQYRGQAAAPTPEEVFGELAELSPAGPVALVFGPEDHGLSNAETALCGRLVRLPTAGEYPVLNLSQAAMLCLYEWHKAAARRSASPAAAPPPAPPAASAHLERMFDKLEDALTRVGFLFADNPKHLMFALRNLVHRARPTPTEADILMGLARQIRWYVDNHPDRRPPG
jgi:tRNA/rRNA methyltransferase